MSRTCTRDPRVETFPWTNEGRLDQGAAAWPRSFPGSGLVVKVKVTVTGRRRRNPRGRRRLRAGGDLARAYRLTPPLVSHYTAPAAVVQKVGALAGRPETQARDVFDLHLLMAPVGPELRFARQARAQLPIALERALGVSYDDYRAQVVAFLEPEHQEVLGSRAAWDDMQTAVVDFIEGFVKA